MFLTEEELFNVYYEDLKIFGKETKYIYEEIFSGLMDEKISFDNIDCLLSEAPFIPQIGSDALKMINDYNAEKALGPMTKEATAKWAAAAEQMLSNPEVNKGWLWKLGSKVKSLFKGKVNFAGFENLIKKGVGFVSNPVNAPKIFGTSAGIVFLMMIIKALKKRKELKYYKSLQLADKKLNGVNEENDFEFEAARAQVIKECKENPKLRKLISQPKETFNY